MTAKSGNTATGKAQNGANLLTPEQYNFIKENKETIKQLGVTLARIARGERFFFNITEYQILGLVQHKKTKTYTKWYLTEKGKRMLSAYRELVGVIE